MLLTFLPFSLFLMQQTPRAPVAKCDDSVYYVDVDDVDVCSHNICLGSEKKENHYLYYALLTKVLPAYIKLRSPRGVVDKRYAL